MQKNTDTVPAMLTPGEFVIRRDAAEQIGSEKLHMLNNIDRLSNSALLENAKSPAGYQEGGEVQDGGFFGLFKDKVGGFIEKQGKNFERAAKMERETGTRNPFLKTALEQRELQRQYGLVPGGETTPPAPPQRPDMPMEQVRYALEMLGDESVYSSDTEKAYQESLPSLIKSTGKYNRYLDSVRALAAGEQEGDVRRARRMYTPEQFNIEMEPNQKISPELDNEIFKMLHNMDEYENRFSPFEQPPAMPENERGGFLDYLLGGRDNLITSRSLMEDVFGLKGYNEGGEVMDNNEFMSVFGEKSQDADGLRALAALIRIQQMQQAPQDATRTMGLDNLIPNNVGRMDAKTLEFLKSMEEPTKPDSLPRMDPETLEFLKRQKEPIGMMGGGYAKPMGMYGGGYVKKYGQGGPVKYQQGGPVEPPMTGGEPMMLEEPPMPMGEQAYYESPANQLGLDQYEHMAYMKHGPDSFRFMAPKYKPRQQWSAYDALVDTGLVNPYEVDRDEVNVVTNDQMEELSKSAQMAMRQ